ncbi:MULTISPECIES: SMI1/KNR4 family protein [Eikenella]|uniref:SMI1/KNR4 family protein n=1 Tax=Eikenella TaxID=538 RepID=UPI000A8E6D90|nr:MULTISPECIES: SMI1/KNR4 family protein [Eikenella]
MAIFRARRYHGQWAGFWLLSPAEIVSYYFSYQFWYYAPNLLPIAFNGGGVFYCYDFGQLNPLIVMKDSGSDYLDVPVGSSLAAVLAQKLDY